MRLSLSDDGKIMVFAIITVVGAIATSVALFRLGLMPADRDTEAGVVTLILVAWGVLGWIISRRIPGTEAEAGDSPVEEELVEAYEMRAVRAFEIGEYENLGPNFFVEFHDGRVGYFGGRWLEELVGNRGAESGAQGLRATFPNTQFNLLLRGEAEELVSVEPEGAYLPPEVVLPPYTKEVYRDAPWGTFQFMNESYDELKAHYAALLAR